MRARAGPPALGRRACPHHAPRFRGHRRVPASWSRAVLPESTRLPRGPTPHQRRRLGGRILTAPTPLRARRAYHAIMSWDPRLEPLLERYPALRAIGDTPLVPVDLFRKELPDVEVLVKMECLNPGGSLKDRPVLRMVLGALADGRLRPGQAILDSSSGNAGIAYAMVGRIIGVPVEIVIPDNASAERKKRLAAHGARLVVTDALLGYDEAL